MKHRKCKAVDGAFRGTRTIVDGCYINEDGTPGKPVCPEEDK